MAGKQSQLRVLIEVAQDGQPLNLETADELAGLLVSDAARTWCDEVNTAISAARSLSNPLSKPQNLQKKNRLSRDVKSRRDSLRRQISALEKQMKELEQAV